MFVSLLVVGLLGALAKSSRLFGSAFDLVDDSGSVEPLDSGHAASLNLAGHTGDCNGLAAGILPSLGDSIEGISSRGERTVNSDFTVRYLEGGSVADLHGQGGGDGTAGNVVLTHDDLSFLIKVLKIRLSLEVLSSTSIVP